MKQGLVGKRWLSILLRKGLKRLLWTQVASETSDYETWRQGFMQKRLHLGLWIALATNLTFIVLELRNFFFESEHFFAIRLVTQIAVQFCLLLCLLLLRSHIGRRYPISIFLAFSWSVTLSIPIAATLNGVMEPAILIWPLMFFGQATLVPVCWKVHLLSQIGVFAYYFGAATMLGLPFKMPAQWLSPAKLYLYLFWICLICNLSAYLYERVQQAEFKARLGLEAAYGDLEAEQERSERLLLNVLPHSIAERLKHHTSTIAESFSDVTVLFADIVGFTEISDRISPCDLVELLNKIFSAFDQLAEDYGLEKIKTIGDAYMVVAGLPLPRADGADAIADMAIAMQQALYKLNAQTGQSFRIRIGIANGPVVAGVIGIKKFIYDLWGDTVNMASRMESHGIPGCIQVTSVTYECLKDRYLFKARGAIQVKGKGQMMTYLLIGKR